MKRPTVMLGLLALGGAIVAIATAIPSLIGKSSSGGGGLPAPAFSLETPAGSTVSSVDLRGHVVVLAFWATWCTPCRQELPDLQRAYERYQDDRQAIFYAVGGPWGGDTIGKEAAFAERMDLTLPLVFDSHGAANALGVYALPTLVILDGDGRLRLFHDGYAASERVGSQIATEVALLEGRRSAPPSPALADAGGQ